MTRLNLVVAAFLLAIFTLTAAPVCAGTSSNVKIVKKLYRAFEQGDLDTITALMDDDIEWVAPGPTTIPFAGTFRGKEGIRKFFSIAFDTLDVREQKLRGFLISGDQVGVLGYEHMLVKATGREYRSNWLHLYTFANGKIHKFEEYVDTAAQAAAFTP